MKIFEENTKKVLTNKHRYGIIMVYQGYGRGNPSQKGAEQYEKIYY